MIGRSKRRSGNGAIEVSKEPGRANIRDNSALEDQPDSDVIESFVGWEDRGTLSGGHNKENELCLM